MAEQPRKQKKPLSVPFYELPANVRSSAEIVSSARNGLKYVTTERPSTPADKRQLFTRQSSASIERPPSSVSIGFYEDSRPPSAVRLSPLDRPLRIPELPTQVEMSPRSRTGSLNDLTGAPEEPAATVPRQTCSAGKRDTVAPTPDSGVLTGRSSTSSASVTSKRVGSATSTTAPGVDPDKDLFRAEVAPLLDSLMETTQASDMLPIIQRLNERLEALDWLKAGCRFKSTILKALFRLLELDDIQLQIAVISLCLKFNLSGANLTNLCKLIYKLCRQDVNDETIIDSQLLVVIQHTLHSFIPPKNYDALVYLLASIKFLSAKAPGAKRLLEADIFQPLLTLIRAIEQPDKSQMQHCSNVLVQLTGCLRNFAELSEAKTQLSSVLPSLGAVLGNYPRDGDLALNTLRTFSKLSMYSECCKALAKVDFIFETLLKLCEVFSSKDDIVVRIFFVLGNLTSRSHSIARRFWSVKRCGEKLGALLKWYTDQKVVQMSPRDRGDGAATNAADILTKLLRLLANLSVDETIGADLSCREDILQPLLDLLAIVDPETELAVTCLAALNNMSYYDALGSAVLSSRVEITGGLVRFLMCNKMEVVNEALHVTGNISRYEECRRILMDNDFIELCCTLLDSSDGDLVYYCVGSLINFLTDTECHDAFRSESGPSRFVDALYAFAPKDPELCCLVCKALVNYITHATTPDPCITDESDRLVNMVKTVINSTDDEELQSVASEVLGLIMPNISPWEALSEPERNSTTTSEEG